MQNLFRHRKERTIEIFAPQAYSQKGGSDSEPSESALASEQVSRACLFAKRRNDGAYD
ncbi:MAG: hypothetical protein L6V93_01020 [Clostridiales bacterium]|nr:MAG: hypothetical protein L6V93_01020 [Clostridiales bacterium]